MAKVFIEETTLTSIGDAIRDKAGTNELISPLDMPNAILNLPSGGGGDLPEEAFNITGQCLYRFAYNGWNWYIDLFGNQININASNVNSMFYNSNELTEIPFNVNCYNLTELTNLFNSCSKLKSVPYVIETNTNKNLPTSNYSGTLTLSYIFNQCSNLREIPDDWFWKLMPTKEHWEAHKNYHTGRNSIFAFCHSLRKLPDISMLHSTTTTTYNGLYYYLCYSCYVLDEAENIPVCGTFTSNAFSDTFVNCHRLSNLIFETNEDGTSKTANWKSQTLNLSKNIGYGITHYDITGNNSGITKDKEVYDNATYQALKNDPDWFTTNINFSRYNKASAVRTINSLPDCSATGTNTIQFTGASGSLTDGGAINTLTEEEIAVAAAKGWSVALV